MLKPHFFRYEKANASIFLIQCFCYFKGFKNISV